MFLRNFLLLSALLISFRSFSQEGKVLVHLQGKENGDPVAYGYVNIYSIAPRSLLFSTTTDSLGNALIEINSYPAEVEVTAIGYDRESAKLSSEQQALKFSLTKRFSSLDEVVVTGVAAPTKPQNALANYKLISAATIRSMGAVTLNEALGNQLNINIGNDQILGAGMRMQGLAGDKVKVMMNGVAVNGREGGNIDLGQINLFNVERIEIVQGPMSIIYGSDALGGVVNVIEKQNRKPYELQATANYESVGKYNVNFGAARSWKKHTVDIGGGRNYFQGWKYLDKPVGYNADTAYPHRNLLFKPKEQYIANAGYQYRASSGLKLSFHTDFLKEKVTNRGKVESYTPFDISAIDEYYYTNRSISRLSLDGKIGRGTWQITNGLAYYKRIRNSYVKDLSTLDETLSNGLGMQDTSKFTDISSRGIYGNKFKHFELTAGYDVLLQQGTTKKIAGDDHFINDYAAFAMVTVPFLAQDALKVQLGLRAAYNTRFQAPIIPAVNVLYSISDRIQLRASYAKGFRAPSLKEMYLSFIDLNHHIIGNENLNSETGDHCQISMSGMLLKKAGNYMQLMVTGYYNDIRNGIVLVPLRPDDPLSIDYQYANQSRQKNVIGTFQLEGQQQSFHYTLGYSINHTFAGDGYSAFEAHEFNSSVSYLWLWAKTNVNVFYKLTGAQPFLRSDPAGAYYDGRQPAYSMLDASLERKFWKKKISVTLGVKNILDVQTLTPTGMAVSSGAHSGDGGVSFLPRSLFTTLRLTLD